MQRMAQDYRLNYRLRRACEEDQKALCDDKCGAMAASACGGTVLRCLQENLDNLKSAECKEEVRAAPLLLAAPLAVARVRRHLAAGGRHARMHPALS